MGSHSVTCHPTEVRITPLPPAEAGTRFSDPGGMQFWVDLCYMKADRQGIEPRPVSRKSNALPLSHHANRNVVIIVMANVYINVVILQIMHACYSKCAIQLLCPKVSTRGQSQSVDTSTEGHHIYYYYYYYYKICKAHKFKHARVGGAGVAGWGNGLAGDGK